MKNSKLPKQRFWVSKMGLVRAAIDSIGGTFSDQWKDFYSTPETTKSTWALFPAEKKSQNSDRGSNTSGSSNVITNGTKFVVPEGYGLVLLQDGAFTGFVSEPGAFIWNSEEKDSKSIFAGGGLVESLLTSSWERFKLGGRPTTEQRAFFVSLKELANNKFGTVSEIYWDDQYLNAQVGANTRGTYTLRITDPLLFIKQFVPSNYLNDSEVFDFTDLRNDAAQQLFNEVVGSLASAFATYLNDPNKSNRISRIQQDSVGFASALAAVIERDYQWKTFRGLEIVSTAITSIEYDEASKALLATAQRADALSGARGNSNLQASLAAGIESAGQVDGSAGLFGIGIAAGTLGIGAMQQPVAPAAPAESATMSKLQELKAMLDQGLITQADYDSAKAKLLGL